MDVIDHGGEKYQTDKEQEKKDEQNPAIISKIKLETFSNLTPMPKKKSRTPTKQPSFRVSKRTSNMNSDLDFLEDNAGTPMTPVFKKIPLQVRGKES